VILKDEPPADDEIVDDAPVNHDTDEIVIIDSVLIEEDKVEDKTIGDDVLDEDTVEVKFLELVTNEEDEVNPVDEYEVEELEMEALVQYGIAASIAVSIYWKSIRKELFPEP
jgi:hypothetical protein